MKFTREDEEKIIEFVKLHPVLYDVKNSKFRQAKLKNKLWIELGYILGCEGETVRKKWSSMRDYFVRSMKRKGTGPTSKRDESMMFLYNTSVVQRPSMSPLPTEFVDWKFLNTGTTSDESPSPKKAKLDPNEVLREFIASRPKPSDFFPQAVDETQQFFDAIACTVKKFDPLTIAKIKMQIANIVGEEEVKWAEMQNKNN